jgi:hypothetical protein
MQYTYYNGLIYRCGYSTTFIKTGCVHALKGLELPRHYSEIALAGPRQLCSTLATAPVLIARAVVTQKRNTRENERIITPNLVLVKRGGGGDVSLPEQVVRLCVEVLKKNIKLNQSSTAQSTPCTQ